MGQKIPQAYGENIWVIRDEPAGETGGIIIPDYGKKKPNTGKIVSIDGEYIKSKIVKVGCTAIFNKASGQEVEFEGTEYTVLRKEQVLGCV